jgi:hypothetical protein
MGNPLHFSIELPQRCLQLIEELWSHVEKSRQVDHPELGSLTTTFLISMSMPILNLPIERIQRHQDVAHEGYADDRHVDPALAKAVSKALGAQTLKRAPFYAPDAWSFAEFKNSPPFNVARSLPDDLAAELDTSDAEVRASNMPTSQWCSIIRNAMAHGGIGYLDEQGRTSFGQPVKMYAFVSGKFDDAEPKKLTGVYVLRIGEDNYRAFLRSWVSWLNSIHWSSLAA